MVTSASLSRWSSGFDARQNRCTLRLSRKPLEIPWTRVGCYHTGLAQFGGAHGLGP